MRSLGIMNQIYNAQNSDTQHIESQSNHTRCNITQYWVLLCWVLLCLLCHIFIDMVSVIWLTVVVPKLKKLANFFMHIVIKINDIQDNYTQPNYTWNSIQSIARPRAIFVLSHSLLIYRVPFGWLWQIIILKSLRTFLRILSLRLMTLSINILSVMTLSATLPYTKCCYAECVFYC